MTRLHSGSWEERAEGMKKVKSDYQNMQRRLNIATRRIEMMSAEVSEWGDKLNSHTPCSSPMHHIGMYQTHTRIY